MGSCQSRSPSPSYDNQMREHLEKGNYYNGASSFPKTPTNNKCEGRNTGSKSDLIQIVVSPSEQTLGTLPETPLFSPKGQHSFLLDNSYSRDISKREESDMNRNRPADSPLIAPSKASSISQPIPMENTSVTPQTIAHFNRLKMQVEKINQQAESKRREKKVQDRYHDVNGYRNLWKEYEQIQELVEHNHDEGLRTPTENLNMDLAQPSSWYFDFHSLDQQRYFHGDKEDDVKNALHLSLHSEKSMKSQQKFFAEKRKHRIRVNRKRYSMKKDKSQESASVRKKGDSKSVKSWKSVPRNSVETVSLENSTNHREDTLTVFSTPNPRLLNNCDCEEENEDVTPKVRTGCHNPRQSAHSVQVDDFTVTSVSDFDVDNDYSVPRRQGRRRSLKDDSSIETFDEKSIDRISRFEFDLSNISHIAPSCNMDSSRKKEESEHKLSVKSSVVEDSIHLNNDDYESIKIPRSPGSRIDCYGFDPHAPLSYQLATFAESVPSVQIDASAPGVVRWRRFSDGNNKVPKTARRLDGLFALDRQEASNPPPLHVSTIEKEKENDEKDSNLLDFDKKEKKKSEGVEVSGSQTPKSKDFESAYSSMSPQNFLMMSACNARVVTGSDEASTESSACPSEDNLIDHQYKSTSTTEPTFQTYDPTISKMSTDDFLRMSSWHTSTIPTDVYEPNTNVDEMIESVPFVGESEDQFDHLTSTQFGDSTPSTMAHRGREMEGRSVKEDYGSVQRNQQNTDAIADKVEAAVEDLLNKFRSGAI